VSTASESPDSQRSENNKDANREDAVPETALDRGLSGDQTQSATDADPFAVQLPEGGSPTASFEAILPVALFLLLNRFLGLGWAIAGATVGSAFSLVRRQRNGIPIGKFLPIVMALIIGRGLIGIITDSETVYFGLGIATKYAIAAGLVISVLIGKNAVARLAPYAFGFGPAVTEHKSYLSATARITLVGALYYLCSATFDIWLLGSGSTERYLLVRTLVNWVVSSGVLVGCTLYLSRRLAEIDGFPGLMPIFEERVEQQAAAFGWDISEPNET